MKRPGLTPLLILPFIALTAAFSNSQSPNPFAELHIRNGLPHFFSGLNKRDTTVIAYLGGSITSAPGYRIQTEQLFRSIYPTTAIKAINAGLGGTGSDLGVFRLQHDVLPYNPDLVFLEFAVNDYGTDTAVSSYAMEGIIRQIKKHNPATDICLLYTLSTPMLEELKQEKIVRSMRTMERLANHYRLPSINLAVRIIDLLKKDSLVFAAPDSTDARNRIVFSHDGVHPIFQGHALYTQTIDRSFRKIQEQQKNRKYRMPAPLYPENYEAARYLSPVSFSRTAGWKKIDSTHPLFRYTPALPDLMYTDDPADSLIIRFTGTRLGIEDIIGPTSCGVQVTIDGQPVRIQRFDRFSARHRRSYFHLPDLANGQHTVVLKLDTTFVDKLNIVKKEEIKDPEEFKENVIYIGKILVVGKPSE